MRDQNRSLVCEPGFLIPSCTNPSRKDNFEIGLVVKKLKGVGRRAQVRTHNINPGRHFPALSPATEGWGRVCGLGTQRWAKSLAFGRAGQGRR